MDKGVGKLADAVAGGCGCEVYMRTTGCFFLPLRNKQDHQFKDRIWEGVLEI